jgi:transposase
MEILEIAGLTAIHQRIDEASHQRTVYAEICDQSEQTRACPYCGAVNSVQRFGSSKRRYRDIPLREYVVIIELKLRRYRCKCCRKVFRQTAVGMDLKRAMTARCVEWIGHRSLRVPFSHLAKEIGCSESVVRDIALEQIKQQEENHRPSLPHWLGIAEVDMGERFEGPLCLLSDLENHQAIEILPNRRLVTLVTWLKSLDETQELCGVCMDFWNSYRSAVRRVFPNVEIVVDKSNVLRLANKALDRVRLNVGKLHPSKTRFDDWKPCQALLRMRRHSLSVHDRAMLDGYLSRHPEIATAYFLKEEFFSIYSCGRRSDATIALERWEQCFPESMRRPFKELLIVLTNWRKEILAYFGNEKALASMEGINSQSQVMSRAWRRYSFEILRGKLLFGRHAPRSGSRRRAA